MPCTQQVPDKGKLLIKYSSPALPACFPHPLVECTEMPLSCFITAALSICSGYVCGMRLGLYLCLRKCSGAVGAEAWRSVGTEWGVWRQGYRSVLAVVWRPGSWASRGAGSVQLLLWRLWFFWHFSLPGPLLFTSCPVSSQAWSSFSVLASLGGETVGK